MSVKEQVKHDWIKFSDNIKSVNRFFIDPSFKEKLINTFRSHEDKLQKGTIIYRARVNHFDHLHKAYNSDEMYAPTSSVVNFGRANPIGIPYLYTGMSKRVCIHEVRPSTFQKITIAEFKLNRNIKIINLDNSFVPSNDEYLEYLSYRLQTSFSQPVVYGKPELEYLPYQYISELIKSCGYNGVLYRSIFSKSISQRNDLNLVLFNQEVVEPVGNPELVTITEVEVKYS